MRRRGPVWQASVANVALRVLEVEHIEKIAERRHVLGNIGIVIVIPSRGIGQIVAAAVGKRRKASVALDELRERSVVAVRVRVPPAGEWRDGKKRNARAVAGAVQGLNEAAVVIAASV